MKITHFQKITLTLNIGVLAFWRVGKAVAAVLSFFELPVVVLSPDHALVRVCVLYAFWQLSTYNGTVCVLDSRACGVCACVFSL